MLRRPIGLRAAHCTPFAASAAVTAAAFATPAAARLHSIRATSATSAFAAATASAAPPALVMPTVAYTARREFFTASPKALARVGRSGSSQEGGASSGWSVMPNFTPATSDGGSTGSQADALTPDVRRHLTRVYNLLALGVGAAAVGSSLMMFTPLGKAIPYFVPALGGLGCMLWLSFRPPASQQARLALFFTFATLEGMAIAPVVKASLASGVLGSALVLTGAVFCGFSAAALMAPRASMLALQGPLFGCLMGMMAISVLNIFYPMAFAHSLLLYGGLAIFSLFIAVDTQSMIERASCGGADHVMDATQLFINVINIFVRVAAILRGMTE